MNLKSDLVCTGIDDNYLWPWVVSVYSAKVNSSENFRVLLGYIKNSLSDKNINLIREFCETLEIEVGFHEFEFNYEVKTSNLPVQAYIRLLWFDLLDEDFLWLDSDTLLLANWQSIFRIHSDYDSKITIRAAIDTPVVKFNLERYPDNVAYQRAGTEYFNSGVFIAHPRVWKSNNFHDRWPEVAARHKDLGFVHHDQDVLNFLLHDSKEILDSSYNSIVMQGSPIEQKILHFTGRPKPWHFSANEKIYFQAIEILKAKNGKGAFGGLNWQWEYMNYWRYEAALISHVEENKALLESLKTTRQSTETPLSALRDQLKFLILKLCGHKWI